METFSKQKVNDKSWNPEVSGKGEGGIEMVTFMVEAKNHTTV